MSSDATHYLMAEKIIQKRILLTKHYFSFVGKHSGGKLTSGNRQHIDRYYQNVH